MYFPKYTAELPAPRPFKEKYLLMLFRSVDKLGIRICDMTNDFKRFQSSLFTSKQMNTGLINLLFVLIAFGFVFVFTNHNSWIKWRCTINLKACLKSVRSPESNSLYL